MDITQFSTRTENGQMSCSELCKYTSCENGEREENNNNSYDNTYNICGIGSYKSDEENGKSSSSDGELDEDFINYTLTKN